MGRKHKRVRYGRWWVEKTLIIHIPQECLVIANLRHEQILRTRALTNNLTYRLETHWQILISP
jgi:hypothetical protein